MEVGAVSYKNNKRVRHMFAEKNKDLVKEIMKSKCEVHPNFQQEHEEYLKALEREKNSKIIEEKKLKEQEEKKGKKAKEEKKKEWEVYFDAADDAVVNKAMAGGDN